MKRKPAFQLVLLLFGDFEQNAPGGFGVQEIDKAVVGARLGFGIDESETRVHKALRNGFDVLNAKAKMVNAILAIFIEVLLDRALGVSSLQELHLGRLHGKRHPGGVHFFALHNF